MVSSSKLGFRRRLVGSWGRVGVVVIGSAEVVEIRGISEVLIASEVVAVSKVVTVSVVAVSISISEAVVA
jgi:hypothetical protein